MDGGSTPPEGPIENLMAKIYIGTSGWANKDWGKKFFPKEVTHSKQLTYLADHFNTVEINATFYRNQSKATFQKWVKETPDDFIFSIKVSRYLTHVKRLKVVEPYWSRFAEPVRGLGKQQGPFLVQLPPNWDGRDEHVARLDEFLKTAKQVGQGLRFAVELRNRGCFSDDMLNMLKKHSASLVMANSVKFPHPPAVATADFVYFRLRGPHKLRGKSDSDKELRGHARLMRKFLKQGKDVFVYFNEALQTNTPENAKLLQKLLKAKR